MDKEQLEKLMKVAHDVNSKIEELVKKYGADDKGNVNSDAIGKAEFEKMKEDFLSKLDEKIAGAIPKKKQFIFGGAKDKVKEGEQFVNFGTFLKMAKYHHPVLTERMVDEQFQKATLTESNTGAYLIPTEYSDVIIGELYDKAEVLKKFTAFNQGALTKNLPKWLTGLTAYWVGEGAVKTKSDATFEQVVSTLKKICALTAMTDEELNDQIVGLPNALEMKVAEAFASEMLRVALEGNTGNSDPFMGIYNAVGVKTVTMAGANLVYGDIANLWNDPQVIEPYKEGSEWFMNRTSFGLILNLVDDNGRPLWNLSNIDGKPIVNMLGDKVNLCSQMTTSGIIHGNPKYVILGQKSGDSSIAVDVSNSAVISSGVEVSENLWTQDETGYRFVLRRSIVVAIPKAFSKMAVA
jgi:HK97 family phage major capsid protein